MFPSALLFNNTDPNNSTIFNRSPKAVVLGVIKTRKLQHLRGSYKHEAFKKIKHKLDLIEQALP